MTPLIEAKGVSVIRQGRHILQNISLQVREKDFITIVGPNGAGKTMLLHCLMGFYPPSRGQIVRAPDLRFAYVPQRLNIDATLPITVERFLRLGIKSDPTAFEDTCRQLDIHHKYRRQLHRLSGGELQRALLARTLLQKPRLIVLDEPAHSLDISGQLSFYQLLNDIYQRNDFSVLMVSHDLHLVISTTKRVICLYHHICCSGPPKTVTRDPEFLAMFGADVAAMMATYHHSHNHTHNDTDDVG